MSSLYLQAPPDSLLHVRTTRPPNSTNKPLLVFLHYWGGSSSTWHRLTTPDSTSSLSSQYSAAAIDLRGWGLSKGPSTDTGASYSASAMAADISSVVQQISTDEHQKDLLANGLVLVGHSMGAKVALATLAAFPVHLLEKVKGLVLVAPLPPTALVLPDEMKAQQKVAYETAESVRWTVANVLGNVENLDESDVSMLVEDSLRGHRLAKEAWPSYGMEEDITQDVSRALASLKTGVRVHILVGELDIVEPRERVENVRRFLEDNGATVSLEVVKGVKHLILLEAPEAVRNAVTMV